MKCPKCGYDNEAIAKFCAKCGTPLTKQTLRRGSGRRWILPAVLLVLIILGASLWFVFSRPAEKSYASLLAKAQECVTQLDYAQAESLYLEAIDTDPERYEAYLSLSQVYAEQDETKKALEILEQAKTRIPEVNQADIDEQIQSIEAMALTAVLSDISGQYTFSSGAGAWSTMLTLNADGTFEGTYQDADMGDTAADYPHGTVYISHFSGSFTAPTAIDEKTYTLTLEHLTTEGTLNDVYIEEGTRYQISAPMGLEDGKEWYVYLPGTDLDTLPEQLIMWLETFVNTDDYAQLPYVSLYNPTTEAAFFRYE